MATQQNITVHKRTSLNRLYRLVDRCLCMLETICIVVAGIALLVMMVLVVFDTLSRYIFNSPLVFQYTLTEEYLLVALFALALSWAFRTGGYIRITGLAHKFPTKIYHILFRIGLLVSGVYMSVLAWTAGKKFIEVLLTGEAKLGVIDWPLDLSWVWVPLGCGLLALRLLLTAVGPDKDLHFEHESTDSEL